MVNCKFILSILNFNFIGVCSAEDSRSVPNYGVSLHNLAVHLLNSDMGSITMQYNISLLP